MTVDKEYRRYAGRLLLLVFLFALLMAMKRYAEYRDIADPERAAGYRKSFAFYTEERLLVSVMFYGTAAMLFLGTFIMQRSRGGVPSITISIPTRYVHTVNEISSVADIEAAITLLARYLEDAHTRTYGYGADLA